MIFMLSVIIPVCDDEIFIHLCLNSILKQTCQDFEVICIDDASTDSSLEILDFFSKKDSRIQVLKNETRKGLKFSRSKGLENSKGEYVTFLKPDEWLVDDTFEMLVERFEKENADIIVFGNVEFKPDLYEGEILEISEDIFSSRDFLNKATSNDAKISVTDKVSVNKTIKSGNKFIELSVENENLSNEISTLNDERKKLISDFNKSKKIRRKLEKDKSILQKKLGVYSKVEIINKIINKDYSNLTIAIKSPHPEKTKHWGDLFFSIALKKSFEKLGFNVIIQPREHWYDETEIDIAFVLRGRVKYKLDFSNINIMWNISHPELISIDEYNEYDQVFISSKSYADKIKNEVNTNVAPLLQCTDPEVFYHEVDDNIKDEILFVGSSRVIYRDIIKDILKTGHDVSVYGRDWEQFIDEKYIKATFIPNEEVHKYYSSCKILLNDHWKEMRDEDFPSNRLFDALACGTFIISDKIPSANTLFEGSIVTYDGVDDLKEKIDYYLAHEDERVKIAEKGKRIVLENHTFDDRVCEILDALKELNL